MMMRAESIARAVALASMAAAIVSACLSGPSALAQAPASPLDQLRSQSEQAEALIGQGDTGAKTQQVQQGIVDGLDTLIAALAAEEGVSVPIPGKQSVPAKLQQPGATTGPAHRPAPESILPSGEWRYGLLRQPGAVTEAWMPQLPPNEQRAISDAFQTGRLPQRYEELLREYNKRLAEERPAGP
jgi:hypothetical protein